MIEGFGVEDGVGIGVAGFARFISPFFWGRGLLYITLNKGAQNMLMHPFS